MNPKDKMKCPDCKHSILKHRPKPEAWECLECKKTCDTKKK